MYLGRKNVVIDNTNPTKADRARYIAIAKDNGYRVIGYFMQAGVASAAFSLQLVQQAVFDCRMVPLPSVERVQDYFL